MQWRRYSEPRVFFKFAGWDNVHLNAFLHSFDGEGQISFLESLVTKARQDMSLLYSEIRLHEFFKNDENSQIDWEKIPYTRGITPTKDSADNLIYVWIRLKKFDYSLNEKSLGQFTEMLSNMLPINKQKERKLQSEAAAIAFHRDEKLTANGKRPSESIYKKIIEYYQAYDPMKHLAPYTSVVGPSGIGKSFAIQQLAMQHNIYVVYVSLARRKSAAYPRRSAIANVLPGGSREDMAEFWECFITIGLDVAEVCKEVGITPAGFYNLQTKECYSAYQTEFSQQVVGFHMNYRKLKKGFMGKMANPKFTSMLSIHAIRSQISLVEWKEELEKNDDNHSRNPTQHDEKMVPRALICLDEASELAKDGEYLLLRSLQEAFRTCFQQTYERIEFSKPQRDFFGVLLDTTLKVGDLSPSHPFSIAQKIFPPIYTLDTMDIFGDNSNSHSELRSPEAIVRLFCLGRPLWGARSDIEAASSPEDVALALKDLAIDRTNGQGPQFALALLSYRLNFNVINGTLAEKMVGKYMRYIVYINEARDLLRTTQPSEPILAFVAAEQMKKPAIRSSVIRQFVASCFEGTVNVGDVGEITAALLLLFAYDEVQFYHAPRDLPAPVQVSHFMASLFGETNNVEITKRMAADPEMKTLWETGEVFFNHFVKVLRVPDEAMIEKAFQRGTALFFPDRFKGADILIPVNVPGSEMTFILVQVKNGKQDHSTATLKDKARNSIARTVETMNLPKNHIGIMMCLRHQPPAIDPQFDIVLPEESCPATRTNPHPSKTYAWPKGPKGLVLAAFGLDQFLYPFMDGCMGQRNKDTERILPLLNRLLDCVPGTSLPDGIDESYVNGLTPFR